MKRSRLFVAVIFVLCLGCGQNNQVANQNNSSEAETGFSEPVETFRRNLTELKQQATNLEAEFKFDSAVDSWQNLYHLVAEKFGADSWQAHNALVALSSAKQKAQFSPAQLQQLRNIARLTEQIKSSFANHQISQALELSTRAYDLQSNLTGPESIGVAQLAIQIATFEGRLSFIDRSIRHFHEGIKILKKHGYEDHPELELAHAGVASLYARKKKYGPAVANQKEATRIAGNIHGINSAGYATQANQLGVLYHQAGNLKVAGEILNAAKLIRQNALGSGSEEFAHSCLNVGIVALDQQNLTEAEENLNKALLIFERKTDSDREFVIRCKTHLATVDMLQKQYASAERFLRDVVGELRNRPSADQGNSLTHQYRLSVALAKQGKYDEAEPLLKSVIEEQQNLFGLSDNRTVNSMRAYALLLESTHQHQAAASVRQQINRVAHMVEGDDFKRRY